MGWTRPPLFLQLSAQNTIFTISLCLNCRWNSGFTYTLTEGNTISIPHCITNTITNPYNGYPGRNMLYVWTFVNWLQILCFADGPTSIKIFCGNTKERWVVVRWPMRWPVERLECNSQLCPCCLSLTPSLTLHTPTHTLLKLHWSRHRYCVWFSERRIRGQAECLSPEETTLLHAKIVHQ